MGFYVFVSDINIVVCTEQPQGNSIENDWQTLKKCFAKYVPADEVACIVDETIQDVVDFREPVPGHFEALENICRENGILIAVDDIQQGFGENSYTWSSVTCFNFTPGFKSLSRKIFAWMVCYVSNCWTQRDYELFRSTSTFNLQTGY